MSDGSQDQNGSEGTWVRIVVESRYKVNWIKVRWWVAASILAGLALLGVTHSPAGRLLAMLSGGEVR